MAESAWPAAAHMDRLSLGRIALVHQVRDPMCWLNSIVGAWAGQTLTWTAPIRKVWRRHQLGDFDQQVAVDPTGTWMRFWVTWNRRIEEIASASLAGRVGDRWWHRARDIDRELVVRIGCRLGIELDRGAITNALARISTQYNTHRSTALGFRDPGLTWDTLPSGHHRDEFETLAREYGYR